MLERKLPAIDSSDTGARPAWCWSVRCLGKSDNSSNCLGKGFNGVELPAAVACTSWLVALASQEFGDQSHDDFRQIFHIRTAQHLAHGHTDCHFTFDVIYQIDSHERVEAKFGQAFGDRLGQLEAATAATRSAMKSSTIGSSLARRGRLRSPPEPPGLVCPTSGGERFRRAIGLSLANDCQSARQQRSARGPAHHATNYAECLVHSERLHSHLFEVLCRLLVRRRIPRRKGRPIVR